MDIKQAEGIASALHKMDVEALRTALELGADATEVDDKKFFEFLVDKQGKIVKEREDRGYQRAQKTVLQNLEKDLRKTYGVEDADLQGTELVEHIVNAVKEDAAAKGGKSKLTDDDIKKHPLYLELEKTKKKETETLKAEYETKIKAEADAREYDRLLSSVDSEAEKIFTSIGDAILPEDASIAAKHKKRLLLDELKAFKFQKNGDEILVLKEDGTRYEDKAGNPVSFKDLVTTTAKQNFQFKAAQDRKSPGGDNNPPKDFDKGAKKYTGAAPKDANDYVKLLTDNSLAPDVKAEIKEVYGAQFHN